MKAGMRFDKYGDALGNYNGQGIPELGGNFTSPVLGNKQDSFAQRALNKSENAYTFYYEIEILKDLPFKRYQADVIPWFGKAGEGKQTIWKTPIDPSTRFPKTWNKLV